VLCYACYQIAVFYLDTNGMRYNISSGGLRVFCLLIGIPSPVGHGLFHEPARFVSPLPPLFLLDVLLYILLHLVFILYG